MKPGLAVYRQRALPPSETFIYNQVRMIHSFNTWLACLERDPGSLPLSDVKVRMPEPAYLYNKAANWAPRAMRFASDEIFRGADLISSHFVTDTVRILSLLEKIRSPLIVTCHGYDVTRDPATYSPGRMSQQWWLDRSRQAFDRADLILCASEFLRSAAIERGAPPERTQVHYLGIPISADASSGERDPNSARVGSAAEAVFIGRLVEVKGLRDVLLALGRLSPGDRPKLTVVGEGPLGREMRALAAELQLDVHFLGARTQEFVSGLLAASDFLVGGSHTTSDGAREGLGLAFLEAGRAGLPVAAYRHGGVQEAVLDGETGLLVSEGDVDALAEGIRRLASDVALRHRLGIAGEARVRRDFAIDRRMLILEKLFADLLARSGR